MPRGTLGRVMVLALVAVIAGAGLCLLDVDDTAGMALRTPDGTDIAPTAVEQTSGSGHHREAVLVFPPLERPENVRIVVKNVGGVAERSFSWELSPTR